MKIKLLISNKFIKNNTLKDLFRVMRVTLIILFVLSFQLFADNTKAQDAVISIKSNKLSVRQLISEIENQTDYLVVYSNREVNTNQRVNLKLKSDKVSAILNEVFANSDIGYDFENNYIVLFKKTQQNTTNIATLIQTVQQQGRTVRGVVVDSNGEPVIGATIVEKGNTSRGTITDVDGNFTLTNTPENATLQITYVGMKQQEVALNGQTTINVVMESDTELLDEVVVVGYGTMKRANLTGAVSTATAERLENRPITSTGAGLQGVIPNLNIELRNGDPTTNASFNIRGYESINGGDPLILVDGIPMNIERLNPNDIKSVTVLKDAAAAAIYGARAAFGVILVETKGGNFGKINVTFGTEQSLAKPILLLDPVTDPYEFVTAWNVASTRTNGYPAYDEDMVRGTKQWSENPTFENAWGVVNGHLRFYGNNNYKNELLSDFAPQQKYDMSISSVTDKTSYYVSFGFLNKDGYLKNNEKDEKFRRYNVLMKGDFKINDWLKLDEKIAFNSQYSDKPHFYNWDVNINSITRTPPTLPIQFPDLPYYIEPGDRAKYEPYIGMYFEGTNFFPYLEDGGRNKFTDVDIFLTQGVTLIPLNGLEIKGDFTYNTYRRNSQDVASRVQVVTADLLNAQMTNLGFSTNDFIDNRNNFNQYYVLNIYGSYEFQKLTDQYLKLMLGYNQEWGKNEYVRAQAANLITPLITDLNATTGNQQVWGSKNHNALRGVFYRLNYSYKDKYLFESNGRYDGTSRFPQKSRFGFFPSFSIGWRISNEPFMADTKNWLDNLKLRASYGELGNQLLGSNYYPYIASMPSGMADYMMSGSGRIPYVGAAGLVSPTLTWETVATKNIGLDFTVLKQRLDVVFDAYIRETKDMLMDVSYPDLLGTSAPKQNAADLRTKGWELSLNWRDKIGQDWRYGLNFSLADNQTKITKYENPNGSLSDYYVGQKMGDFWGYETEGIFQTDEEVLNHADQSRLGNNWKAGDIKYADLDGDKKITPGNNTLDNPGDRRIIGNTTPRYSFGLNTDISYKNWSLNLFFQGLLKRDYLPPGDSNWQAFYPFKSGYLDKYYMKETWSEDNPDAYFAAPHISSNNHKNTQNQSRYVQNAAYVRLKNITLNYNLPSEFIKGLGLDRTQIYLSGMNLWEFTKMHKPLDPESVYTLTQEYWKQRIFTFGIKVTL